MTSAPGQTIRPEHTRLIYKPDHARPDMLLSSPANGPDCPRLVMRS